ncbi:GPW/gp25 family protein [Bacteroides sp. GD17]|jgi:phage baseplate assembly protein W|uniref:GPW/gp25 family protein n=1 Tax=Bacteroides sp. GD17 TaxID=3139826 RepID=UPI00206429CF|nr:MAG TPA: Baseplate wedge protein [Bacteriophage sp.]
MNEERENSFLGRGWAFPPNFEGGVNPTSMVAEEEDIRQSLRVILSTRKGERIMRPDFGTDLHNLVFHNMDLTARTQLRAAIEEAILYWEPRIQLTNVSFDMSEERDGKLYILLEYTIRQTNSRGNMVYPFYYEEHF